MLRDEGEVEGAVLSLMRWDVKVFLETAAEISWRPLIEVFHRWIQDSKPDGILVDVAEYTHVAPGPQVLLIAHEGQWVLDTGGRGQSLLYSQRRLPEGSGDPLRRALKECLSACKLLESEPEVQASKDLKFQTDRLEIIANDRLRAPNLPATYEVLEPAVHALLSPLYGGAALDFSRETDPRRRAGLFISAPRRLPISELLAKL